MIALRSLFRGMATSDQQRLALAWIVGSAAGVDSPSYSPGDATETAYMEGRRSVGLHVVKHAGMARTWLETGVRDENDHDD